LSLILIAAAAVVAQPSAAPAHSLQLDHHGTTYTVDYVTHVETRSKAIGMSPPTRPSTRRCIVTAEVSVERRIQPASGGHAVTTRLPGTRSFTQNTAGDCRRDGRETAKFAASKSGAIADHVRTLAAADHRETLAAIDAARNFAVN
jgi:hypothetical protein